MCEFFFVFSGRGILKQSSGFGMSSEIFRDIVFDF